MSKPGTRSKSSLDQADIGSGSRHNVEKRYEEGDERDTQRRRARMAANLHGADRGRELASLPGVDRLAVRMISIITRCEIMWISGPKDCFA